MKQGFTIVELIIGVAILSIVSLGIYLAFTVGDTTYKAQTNLITLQQQLRQGTNSISRELREASAGNTTVNTANITFNTTDENGIQYYLNTTASNLMRQNATTSRVLANNIKNVAFSRTADVVTINLTTEKNVTFYGGQRVYNLSYEVKVRLRNE